MVPARSARETEVRKERWRRQGGEDKARVIEEKRSGRLVDAAETSKELAKWRRLQRKKLHQ